MPRWAAEGKESRWDHFIWQDSLLLGTLVICSPGSLWSLCFISARCHAASACPVVLVKHWAREGEGLAAQSIRKHRLSCLRRTASKQCSSVYSLDNRIKAIRLINVKLSESRISPPMEKQGEQLIGAFCWSQIIHACVPNGFFAFPKLRTASSLPRSQRSSVYETPGEKVSVESFEGTKILQIFLHGPVCLPAAYILFLIVTVCFFQFKGLVS